MGQLNHNTTLIIRELETETGIVKIGQRPDGYINLTPMVKAARKLVADWLRSEDTKEYLEELSSVMGIPITELIIVKQGGAPKEQGTWAHPQPALKCAAWCNKKFEVQVYKWIDDLRTTGKAEIVSGDPFETFFAATANAIKALREEKANITYVDFVHKKVEHGLYLTNNRIDHIEKDIESKRRLAQKRYQRTAPKSHILLAWDIAGGRCINPHCRKRLEPDSLPSAHNHPDYDEVIPVVDGGRRTLANIQVICHECNLRKSRHWFDYRPKDIRFQAERMDPEGARECDIMRSDPQLMLF
jgi:5-methylcytosine-specific restriction endonuclease McrA